MTLSMAAIFLKSTGTRSRKDSVSLSSTTCGNRRDRRSYRETRQPLGAQIAGLAFIVELDFLKGRDR